MEIGKETKGKIRVDLVRMDEQFQRYLDKAWMSQKIHEEAKDWEIDCSKLMIKNQIAKGTFGSVYRGVYDGKDVAVKVVDFGEEGKKATQWKVFIQELTIWKQLDHPNITKLIGTTRGNFSDVGIVPGCGEIDIPRDAFSLVVEFLPGGTLKSLLFKNRTRKLPFKLVIQLALDIANGLSYLHSQKVVHRDVKTENMVLDAEQRVKITDFGVSRIEALNAAEMTGGPGTLGYMAPEVLSGSPYDHKCDVYSFGICLWEIFCCTKPYSDVNCLQKTPAAIYKNQRPTIPKFCPRSLSNIIKQCWDTDPERRPEMEEVVHLLESIDKSIDEYKTNIQSQLKLCLCFFKQKVP